MSKTTDKKIPFWVPFGGGIYRNKHGKGSFHHRVKIDGVWTFRVLKAATLEAARKAKLALDSQQTLADAGVKGVQNPYADAPPTVGELFTAFEEVGCPKKDHHKREGSQLEQEKGRIKFLLPFWKNRVAKDVRPSHCEDYFVYRKDQIRKGCSGTRAVDMELTTLTGMLRWALFKGKLDLNPLAQRVKFRDNKKIQHCRNFMPKSGADFHALARALFQDPRSESLGWQILLEGMIGCRTTEILRCRWDAKSKEEAGFIERNHLYLNRCKDGINPYVVIHPALEQALAALKKWRALRKEKDSPWFIPSHRNPGEPVSKCALSQALRRISVKLLDYRVKSHGFRGFYVTVRRSMGISDEQIAAEIGDATGAQMIVDTYGGVPPNWHGGPELTWMVDEPAWTVLAQPDNIVALTAG